MKKIRIILRLSKIDDIDLLIVFKKMNRYGALSEAAEAVCEAFRDHIFKGTYRVYVPELYPYEKEKSGSRFLFTVPEGLFRQVEAGNIPRSTWLKILFRRYMRIPVELCVGLPICDECCRNAMLKDHTGQTVSVISAARENSLPKPVNSPEPEKPQKEVKEQDANVGMSEFDKIAEKMKAELEEVMKIESIENIQKREKAQHKNEDVNEEEPNLDFLLDGLI